VLAARAADPALLEVEGEPGILERFLKRLPGKAPPLATIERITRNVRGPGG
jgi:hydrogenase maturation factor HypF (carbamoyltransferase family)